MSKERIELLVGISVVVLVGVGVYLLSPQMREVPEAPISRGIETPPPVTPALEKRIAESRGFQALVSYTERGFEPSVATIKRGDTVRFTNNNAGSTLWVAATADSGSLYPGSGDCGQSSFDSCVAVSPGEFWEFTFEEIGTWSFKNNANVAHAGVIAVQ